MKSRNAGIPCTSHFITTPKSRFPKENMHLLVMSLWYMFLFQKWDEPMRLTNTVTDYGCLMKPFFIKIPNFWTLADKLGRKILLHLAYFWQKYQHPFWYSQSLVHIQPLFVQKTKPLYPHPNIYLGLGFEFGPQRIKGLAFVCP